MIINSKLIDKYINLALSEDIFTIDITTENIFSPNSIYTASLISKDSGILCGLDIFKRVFSLNSDIKFSGNFKDGDIIKPNDIILTLEGDGISILKYERVALNYLQRMSGIATKTNSFIKKINNPKIKILDTRKTTPNMRIFEKYSTKIGGAFNHRFSLSDGVLIKDNHISACGSIKKAVELVSKNIDISKKIEVEAETLSMVKEALDSKVDIIMLDNMDIETIQKAISLINKKALIEVSGNIDYDNIEIYRNLDIDFISTSSLFTNFKTIDFSLKNMH